MSRKSNKEICDFYFGKNRDEITLKYYEKVGIDENKNPYLQLYKDFNVLSEGKKNFEDCQDKDNVSLFKVLQAWKEPEKASYPIDIFGIVKKEIAKLGEIADASQMPNLDFLKNIDIDILHPDKNRGEKANQKWHLYVGVFAYSVVCQKEFKWDENFNKWGSVILRLWIIENAEGQEAALKEIEEAIDRGEDVKPLIKSAFYNILEGDICI